MDQKRMVAAAIAGLFALGTAYAGHIKPLKDDPKGMEKCWGAAKAGQNDCGSNKTAHACAGHSKMDGDLNDFKYVKTGTCTQMGGSLKQGVKPGKT